MGEVDAERVEEAVAKVVLVQVFQCGCGCRRGAVGKDLEGERRFRSELNEGGLVPEDGRAVVEVELAKN